MPRVFITPEYQEMQDVLGEVMDQTDRAAAIVAFAFLEDILENMTPKADMSERHARRYALSWRDKQKG